MDYIGLIFVFLEIKVNISPEGITTTSEMFFFEIPRQNVVIHILKNTEHGPHSLFNKPEYMVVLQEDLGDLVNDLFSFIEKNNILSYMNM
jgi:hypothetical protein